MTGQAIRISGAVQGVGFRPTVWRLAKECGICGSVWNDAEGVLIHAWGDEQMLVNFKQRLFEEQPPLASIEEIITTPLDEEIEQSQNFQILASRGGKIQTEVTPDAATCADCLAEVLDPLNRRYRYPFTNCTHCGPRLSIIKAIPYDRSNTSMADFILCPKCQAEYDEPADRRFHAQPNACPVCGPRIWLEDHRGVRLDSDEDGDVITTAARLIREGRIVALKGIGGIHLACDASNEAAVARLRQRKSRYAKPLALMAADLAMVERYARVDEVEAALLQNRAAPIVVLDAAGEDLAASVSLLQHTLGFMPPYTPLHHLLMRELPYPVVLTSGNYSNEPQTISNALAHERLADIADYFLLHDRKIINRLDDSVIRIADGQPRLLRRARGDAPRSIPVPPGFAALDNILALGGELKNSFCLMKSDRVIMSQYIGDLEELNTYQDYLQTLDLYQQLFDFSPDLIVVDKHPDYLSTQLGKKLAAEKGLPLVEVQHHHAHIAACMAEHSLPLDSGKVLGVALDGLGYGENDQIWGGEFLLADYQGYQRLAYFQPVSMLGGNKAVYEPWRNTLAHLFSLPSSEQLFAEYAQLEIIQYLNAQPLPVLRTMFAKQLNSPLASSAGRLFDAVAAAIGICRESVDYEGQAAMMLEARAVAQMPQQQDRGYGFVLKNGCLGWEPLWKALLEDLKENVSPTVIAARFHHGLSAAVATTAVGLCREYQADRVVLGGGVFQNRLLLEQTSKLLREHGLDVFAPAKFPANDGGLSLGQSVIALAAGKNISGVGVDQFSGRVL